MYSDIIPPKKNSFINTKRIKGDGEMRIIKDSPTIISRPIYHTIDGKDKKSNWSIILLFVTIILLSIIYYSVFNNKTYISFESKTVILEVKDKISMILSEENGNSSSTLSYNLIYANENKDRNIFAPSVAESTTTVEKVATNKVTDFYVLKATSTSQSIPKNIIFINESGANVQVIDQTRLDVNGEVFYLQGKVNIPPTSKDKISTTTNKYKVIGFKGTNNYDKFYAVDYIDTNTAFEDNNLSSTTAIAKENVPNNDILSLIPDNFIPLKKGYVYDKTVNQGALVVIDKKDFEKALHNNSKLIQEYIKIFTPISDLVEYDININDYDLELSPETGLPLSFKNLSLEIIPRIKRDKVAAAFAGFSKETMKKIKSDISKNINMETKFSPFWMNKVSDIDNIVVEVK